MGIIIGIALLLIIVIVLDCIRYKHSQSKGVKRSMLDEVV